MLVGRAGAAVAELAGRHLKKVVLELGGSDPFIVLSTDDLDATVDAAIFARTDNNGQACNAGNDLGETLLEAQVADTSDSPVWSNLRSALSDLSHDSSDRLSQVPSGSSASSIGTVIVLGLAMLLMTTAFLPTRVRAYRVAISILAALTSLLLFVMVEASNPYVHYVSPPEIITSNSISPPS